MKFPDDIDGLLDDVAAFHSQVRSMMGTLPPTPAKQLLNELLPQAQPLVEQLRDAVPKAKSAMELQHADNLRKFEKAKQDLQTAKSLLADMPTREQKIKNIVPLAAELPSGLSAQYSEEMASRYAKAPVFVPETDGQAAAWQDWSIS